MTQKKDRLDLNQKGEIYGFKLIKARMLLVNEIPEVNLPYEVQEQTLDFNEKSQKKTNLKQVPKLTWILNSISRKEKEIRISHLCNKS